MQINKWEHFGKKNPPYTGPIQSTQNATYVFWMYSRFVEQSFEVMRYKPEGRGFDSRWCLWNISLISPFRQHYGHGVDSDSDKNEYQEYFLGCKGGRRVWLTILPTSWAECLEIWEPQLPGTLRAWRGLYLFTRVLWWATPFSLLSYTSRQLVQNLEIDHSFLNTCPQHSLSFSLGMHYALETVSLTFRHRASCILGQAFHSSPENAFYIFNQQIYLIIWCLLDRTSLI